MWPFSGHQAWASESWDLGVGSTQTPWDILRGKLHQGLNYNIKSYE